MTPLIMTVFLSFQESDRAGQVLATLTLDNWREILSDHGRLNEPCGRQAVVKALRERARVAMAGLVGVFAGCWCHY